jgi:hypothetical protein
MIRRITVLFVLIISVALVGADLIVSAQNTNSSTTQSDEQTRGGMMTTQNGNQQKILTRRRGRGRRPMMRRILIMPADGDTSNANMSGDMSGNANMSGDTQNTNMSGDMSGKMIKVMKRRGRRGRRRAAGGGSEVGNGAAPDASGMTTGQTGTERTDGGMQEDLSGQSYTGTASYSEGGVNGPATLAFESGNQFTLTPEGGSAMSGRYSAVTTRGYTGVTMMFSGATPAQIVSVRLKKMGNGVSIMSVPGENRQFSFTSTGGGGGHRAGGMRRPRRRRGRRGGNPGIKPPMANPDTNPDATPSPTP